MKIKKTSTAYHILALLVIILTFFNSCKKDPENTANTNQNPNLSPNPNPVVSDSTEIFKWYLIDSSATSQDTSDIFIYNYDSQRRLVKIYEYDSEAAGTVAHGTAEYFYNGTDSLPFLSYSVSENPNHHDTTNAFFFYDGSGKRLRDSVIRSFSGVPGSTYTVIVTINSYWYTTGQITGHSTQSWTNYSSSGTTYYNHFTEDTAMLDANGNYVYTIKNKDGLTRYQTSIINDTSTNIFYHINTWSVIDPFPEGLNFFCSKKNAAHITENKITLTSNTTKDWNFTYTYNNKGLVKQMVIENPDFSPGHYDKSVFVYQ